METCTGILIRTVTLTRLRLVWRLIRGYNTFAHIRRALIDYLISLNIDGMAYRHPVCLGKSRLRYGGHLSLNARLTVIERIIDMLGFFLSIRLR
jgi:hypothetical protein